MSAYEKFLKKYGKDPILPPPTEQVPEVDPATLPPPPSIKHLSDEELEKEWDQAPMSFPGPEKGGAPTVLHGKGNVAGNEHNLDNLIGKTPSEIEREKIKDKSTDDLFREFDELLGRKPTRESDFPKEASRADQLLKRCNDYYNLAFK